MSEVLEDDLHRYGRRVAPVPEGHHGVKTVDHYMLEGVVVSPRGAQWSKVSARRLATGSAMGSCASWAARLAAGLVPDEVCLLVVAAKMLLPLLEMLDALGRVDHRERRHRRLLALVVVEVLPVGPEVHKMRWPADRHR